MNAQTSEQHALYLVSAETGEVVSRTPDLTQALKEIERLEQELQDVERERRTQRAHIKRLYAQLDADRKNYPRREEVVDIWREWTRVCGHKNARLTDDRFDAVKALLEVEKPKPYSRAAFTAAIAGAAFDPFITTRKNGSRQVFDDLELVCRDGRHFEEFIKKAPQTDSISGTNRAGSALDAPAPTPGVSPDAA